MKIKNVICSKGYTGFYFDDQQAIKKGAIQNGFHYIGTPINKSFQSIRQPGETVSIMLVLESDDVIVGDCAAVQYSGTGGRDPLFKADDAIEYINKHIKELLIGLDVSTFKQHVIYIDNLEVNNRRIHTALRYGITGALLKATAFVHKLTIAEIVRKEYEITGDYKRIPLFAQTGDDRYQNVDKMIIKEVDVLPHALINNIETKLGFNGELLHSYIIWLRDRIIEFRSNNTYLPTLHIDVYGTVGIIFNNDYEKIVDYLLELEQAAKPFILRIEGPIDKGNKTDTLEALSIIQHQLNNKQSTVEVVADEWCNTLEDIKDFATKKAGKMLQIKTPDLGGVNNIIEALLYCNNNQIGAYSGGTCNETNISAEITTNIAIACNATQVLAKPGMGTDEGIMIVHNEMERVLTLIESRKQ